ncbi:MAG: hypothetical protein WA609_17280 [Terriglobales bacterium]
MWLIWTVIIVGFVLGWLWLVGLSNTIDALARRVETFELELEDKADKPDAHVYNSDEFDPYIDDSD